jgi:hypothetical protein
MMNNKNIGLSVLALSLAFSLPAYAQDGGTQPSSPPATGTQPMMGMEHKGPMHPEFREDMEKMRGEQEDLDIARDKLLDRCMFTSKELAPSCTKEKEDLRMRSDKLRENRKAMHEKMETMRKERTEMMERNHERMEDHKMIPMGEKATPTTKGTPAKK